MTKEPADTAEDNPASWNASPKDGRGSCATRIYANQQFLLRVLEWRATLLLQMHKSSS